MENNHNHIIETVATVMTDSFKEDPGSMAMMEGIKDPEKLFMAHTLLHGTHAFQTKSLRILDDDPRAFLIGYDSIHENKFLERKLYLKIIMKTITHPSTEIIQYCMIRYPEEAAIMQRA